MDLRSLYYFVTVAEERNITRAAERLNMSQPPLSAQIKGLEEELGIQLFIRGKRQLTITDAGVLLLRRALVEGRAPYLLARWIAGFRAEFPKVTVHLWNGSGDDVLERLNRGLADLALVAAPYNAELMEGITVGREPWVAILSRQHPLAQEEGDFLPLRKLVGQPLFIPSRQSRAEAVRTWFEELGEEPLIAGDLSNYIDAEALAEQNAGICIYPMTTYTENELLTKKIITESARQIEYALVWNKNAHLSDLEQEFINFVRDCLEDERQGTQTYRVPEREYLPPEDTLFL